MLKEAEFNAVHSHLFSHLGVMTTSPVIWLVKLAHSNNSPATTTTSGHKHDQRIFGHTLLVFAIRIMATFETALMLDANLSEHARPADSARTARQVVDKIRDAIAAAPASLAVYGQSLNAESIKDGPQGGLAPASTAFSIFLSFVDDCIEAQNGPYPINIAFRFGNESSANVADPFDDSHSVITLRSPTHCHAAILSALSIVQLLLSRCEMLRTHYGRFVYLLTIAIRSLSAATPMEALANVRRSYLDLAVGVSRAESSQKNTDQLTVAVLEMSSQIVLDDEASPVETIAAAHALQFVTSIPRPSLALSASLATVFARRKVRLLAVAQDQSSSIFRRVSLLLPPATLLTADVALPVWRSCAFDINCLVRCRRSITARRSRLAQYGPGYRRALGRRRRPRHSASAARHTLETTKGSACIKCHGERGSKAIARRARSRQQRASPTTQVFVRYR